MEPTTARVRNGKLVLIGIIGFLIGFTAAFLILSKKRALSLPVDRNSSSVNNEMGDEADLNQPVVPEAVVGESGTVYTRTSTTGNVIIVADQHAGMNVTVATASAGEASGWVVIHEDDRGGPGVILGARRLDGGVYTNIVVELLRATIPDRVYYAMLHSDDGDKLFDLHKDLPLTDESGRPFMMRFSTTGE